MVSIRERVSCADNRGVQKTGILLAVLAGIFLAPVRVESGEPFRLAVLGDSISDTYFLKVSLTQRGWADQLRILRPDRIELSNRADAGSTSETLLRQGRHEAVARLVRQGKVDNVCLIIGGNDLGYPILFGGNRRNLAEAAGKLVKNVTLVLDTVQAAGSVAIVLGNVPDLGQTPMFGSWASARKGDAAYLSRVTEEVNQQLEALARQRGIPLVDLHGLVSLSRQSVVLGGVEVSKQLYTSEGLHPSTIGSGLLGNAILEAFHLGHGRDVSDLQLSDAEILAQVGQKPTAEGRFDVSRFVILPPPAPAAQADSPSVSAGWPGGEKELLLAASIAVGGLAGYWLLRRRRRA